MKDYLKEAYESDKKFVENLQAELLQPGFRPAFARPDHHLKTLVPFLDHFPDQFRRVLKVGVNDQNRFPYGPAQPCAHRQVLPEIARQLNHLRPDAGCQNAIDTLELTVSDLEPCPNLKITN